MKRLNVIVLSEKKKSEGMKYWAVEKDDSGEFYWISESVVDENSFDTDSLLFHNEIYATNICERLGLKYRVCRMRDKDDKDYSMHTAQNV